MKNLLIPPTFDPEIYKKKYSDLVNLTNEQLQQHYLSVGKQQGRIPNNLETRKDFINLIPSNASILEIGPFFNPLIRGANVKYCDVLDQEELRKRATQHSGSPKTVPFIDYVLGEEGLDGISDQFDIVVSCHNIEHSPDLVTHLQQLEKKLNKPHGKFFTLIPDKRFCFDRNISQSSIADVLEAFLSKRKRHTAGSLIEHRVLTTHNDSLKHWREQSSASDPLDIVKIKNAINEFISSGNEYIDVHAWQFTPESFSEIIDTLQKLDLINLKIEQLYSTRNGSSEFWAILGLKNY